MNESQANQRSGNQSGATGQGSNSLAHAQVKLGRGIEIITAFPVANRMITRSARALRDVDNAEQLVENNSKTT